MIVESENRIDQKREAQVRSSSPRMLEHSEKFSLVDLYSRMEDR